jgi:aminoglycoside 3-N-acetyltransferase
MHSRQELSEDLRKLGLRSGDLVMLHASVRAVGEIAGGPDQIHLAIKDVITGDGTVIMYAGCPDYFDEIGRGELTKAQETELLEKLPPFDPLTARAYRENGALVEFFRTFPDSRVNHHPARFVAWGKQVDYLFSYQPWNYGLGAASALERFCDLDGRILLLGCDHDNVTLLHYAEHIVEIPDKRLVRFKIPVEDHGRRIWREVEEYDTSGRGVHVNWPDRFFAKLVDSYLRKTRNRGGHVGDAPGFILPARDLLEFALKQMRSIAKNRKAAEALVESRK